MERVHDVQHVVGQLAARAVRPAGAQRVGHVGDADAAAVLGVAVASAAPRVHSLPPARLHLAPARRSRSGRARSASPRCRRSRCAAGCAAQTSKLVMIVPTAPLAKSITPATCVGTSTLIFVPYFGSLVIVRSGKVIARRAGHALDRAQQGDQRGQVVRAHVEHRAAADLVVELGIRMPALVAVADHERGRGRPARRSSRRR